MVEVPSGGGEFHQSLIKVAAFLVLPREEERVESEGRGGLDLILMNIKVENNPRALNYNIKYSHYISV